MDLKSIMLNEGFPGVSLRKESTCNAEDTGDLGLIPGSEDLLQEGMATYSIILAWRIPRREEAGRL